MELRKIAVIFGLSLFFALAANGGIFIHVLQLHTQALLSQENRQKSLQITDDIQRETASLSRMVRAYTTTADNRFLNYYYDIIAIRQGEKAAPEHYGTTYWAEVMAGSRTHVMPPEQAGVSVRQRMERQGFNEEEFKALDAILAKANTLFEQDQIAFAATQGLYDLASGEFSDEGKPQMSFANLFVNSSQYLRLENELAQELAAFSRLTDQRTVHAVQQVSSRLSASIFAANIILAVTLLLVVLAMDFLRRMVLAPMRMLAEKSLSFGSGDYSIRADTRRGVRELRSLGQTFNAMAANIQEDISQCEQIQQDLQIATARAEELTRVKSLFLANMSHEIRTPMNAIIGMTYLVLQTSLDQRQQDYISKIQHAAQSLLRIINDILDFSKIEAGKLELERVPFSLEEVVGSTFILLHQRAVDKEIELLLDVKQVSLLGSTGWFWGDPLRVEQVLTNLLTNAVKFTEHGYVLLTVAEESAVDEVCLVRMTVLDTGIGMSPQQVGRLFQEFSQADGSTTRRHGGTGLGLSISRKLVQLMHGEISVVSQPEQGSTFTCTIPLARAEREVEKEEADRALGAGLRALIVDDHPAAREVLVSLLALFGVQSVAVASGAAALAELDQEQTGFDMVLLDWVMPGMGGEELLLAIKDMTLPVTPLLAVVSAYDMERIYQLCDQQRICQFLPKPVLPKDLRHLLRQVRHLPDTSSQRLPDRTEQISLQGMRVLLVEDNAINQQIAGEMLALYGATIDLAGNGREALDILCANRDNFYQAVLMDIQMPVMDGFAATRKLRQEKRFSRLPVIAMTAHAMQEERERCLAAGMNAHVSKPFAIQDLVRALAPYYQKPAASVPPPAGTVAEELTSEKERLLSRVPGLDFRLGLERCAGNCQLYERILQGYARDYNDISERMRAHLNAGEWEELTASAHTLKGLSGSIGAPALADLAETIESASRRRSPVLRPILKELARQLKPVLAALEEFGQASGEPASQAEGQSAVSGTALADAGSSSLLAQLHTLLLEADSAAQDFWSAHQQHFIAMLDADRRKKIHRAISHFAFEEAARLLPLAAQERKKEENER